MLQFIMLCPDYLLIWGSHFKVLEICDFLSNQLPGGMSAPQNFHTTFSFLFSPRQFDLERI
jgi:hypothetical protein